MDGADTTLAPELEAQAAAFDAEWSTRGRPSSTPTPRGRSTAWRRVAGDLPAEIPSFLKKLVRRPGYRLDALDLAERMLGFDRRTLGPVRTAAAWRTLIGRGADVQQVLRAAAGAILAADHCGRLTDERPRRPMPPGWMNPVVTGGALHVIEPMSTAGVAYLPSYLEVTPPVVVGRALQLAAGRSGATGNGCQFGVWDITAGSGTGATLVQAAGICISTDIVAPYGPVVALDARDIGTIAHHGRRTVSTKYRGSIVRSPDLVLFDPPSRGWPTHTSAYDPGGYLGSRDLGLLDREQWIETVVEVTTRALSYVAERGIVSLLLREGTRDCLEVNPDETIGTEVVERLRQDASIVDDLRVVHWQTRPQAFAGKARLPMRHVVLARRAP